MSYLKSLGVTALWISPPVDNLNLNIPDGSGNPTAAYHGYQARDFSSFALGMLLSQSSVASPPLKPESLSWYPEEQNDFSQ
jgi:hypothetical protein